MTYKVLTSQEKLSITTPYMLRNDGELLTCGEIHPYIKSYRKESLEKTLKYLDLHKSFLEWFYNNSLNEETKSLIKNFDKTEKTIDRLWYLTNQEFCRVRTSNYRYKIGGDNGEIYFRISSENFNWFDLIWNTCVKFIHSIDYVTIMKDPQTFGKQFDYIIIRNNKINKFPIKEFIELEGEPLVENKQEITEAKYLMPYDKNKIIEWMQNHFKVNDLPVEPIKGPQLIDLNGDFVQIQSFHGNILKELRKDRLIKLDDDSTWQEYNYFFSDLFEEIGYIRCNGGIGGDGYSYLSLPSKNKPNEKQIEALLLWIAYFPVDYGFDICRAEGRCIWTSENDEKTVLHNINELYKLSEELKDEASENTLKKRRKYYLTHGLKNVFPSGLGESLDTNNIISLLSNTFGTTDEPQPTAMYVLPNGKFLYTTPLEPSDDCDYEIDEHRNIDDFLFHKGIIEDDRYLEDDGSLFTENVLNCIRFNISDEYYGNYAYIQLNQKQPTSQQYDSLLKVFDYVITHRYKYLSIILDNQYGKQVKLELNNYTADELLKKIKRFYVSGILTENKKSRNIVFETIVHSKAMEELNLTFNNNSDALKFLNSSILKLENAGINFYKLSIVEDEGKYKIPNTDKKIHFYALKNTSLQIRCYFFLSNGIFYIGRIIKKDYQKLDKKDLEKTYWRFNKDNVK